MKSWAIVFVLVVAVGITAFKSDQLEENNVRDIVSNLINNTINKILNNMSDPTSVDEISLSFNDNNINGYFNLSSIIISGIKSIVATSINVSLAKHKLDMIMEVHELSLGFKYLFDLVLADLIPLYGSGPNSIGFTGVNLNVTGAVNLTDGIKLNDVGVFVTMDSAWFNLNGLLNNNELSALVNEALNDNFVPFVNDNNHLLSSILGKIVEDVINGFVGTGREILDYY